MVVLVGFKALSGIVNINVVFLELLEDVYING